MCKKLEVVGSCHFWLKSHPTFVFVGLGDRHGCGRLRLYSRGRLAGVLQLVTGALGCLHCCCGGSWPGPSLGGGSASNGVEAGRCGGQVPQWAAADSNGSHPGGVGFPCCPSNFASTCWGWTGDVEGSRSLDGPTGCPSVGAYYFDNRKEVENECHPYSKRRLKSQKYQRFILQADGMFLSKMVPGPACCSVA